jgi:hypothetical protein
MAGRPLSRFPRLGPMLATPHRCPAVFVTAAANPPYGERNGRQAALSFSSTRPDACYTSPVPGRFCHSHGQPFGCAQDRPALPRSETVGQVDGGSSVRLSRIGPIHRGHYHEDKSPKPSTCQPAKWQVGRSLVFLDSGRCLLHLTGARPFLSQPRPTLRLRSGQACPTGKRNCRAG